MNGFGEDRQGNANGEVAASRDCEHVHGGAILPGTAPPWRGTMSDVNVGFTRDDVNTIREAAEALGAIAKTANTDVSGELRKLASIADRIEALLSHSQRA